MAEDFCQISANALDQAEDYLRSGAVSNDAREHYYRISRHAIFLKVLDDIRTELKESNPVITSQLTIDDQ